MIEQSTAQHGVEFHVRLDGAVDGLAQHRLSLSAFLGSLQALLNAFRRQADVAARGVDAEGSRRFGRQGEKFDLQLFQLTDGCVNLAFECKSSSANGVPYAEEAAKRVVRALAVEAKGGESHSPSIRRFLELLPSGVSSQTYEAKTDGKVIARAEFGELAQIERRRKSPPRLVAIYARVMAATFSDERATVRLRELETGKSHSCSCTPALRDKAVDLRRDEVIAKMVLCFDRCELLSIRQIDEPEVVWEDPGQRLTYILEHWKTVLHRLAD